MPARFVLIAIGLAIMLVAAIGAPGLARDDGRFDGADPGIKAWIKDLTDQHGQGCCDTADGYPAEARWDTKAGRYNVNIDGLWVEVPAHAVVRGPNKLGYAMEWHVYSNGVPKVRCFLPGKLS